jgi:hypothetical protein
MISSNRTFDRDLLRLRLRSLEIDAEWSSSSSSSSLLLVFAPVLDVVCCNVDIAVAGADGGSSTD